MTEIQTVEAFLRALAASDLEAAIGMTSDDIVYQNVPLPPARGRAAFEKQMRSFQKFTDGFEVAVRNIAANGPVVLTERVDTLIVRGARAEFWVCGTFEVRDGRIALWRDYFDWATFSVQSVLAVPRAVLGALRGASGRG